MKNKITFEKIKLKNRGIIGVWEIKEDTSTLKEKLLNFSFYEKEFLKLKTEKRQKEFLISRILLQELTKKEQEVYYNSKGKPFLKNKSYRISISHTKNYVAVIIHPNLSVGIDIETVNNKIIKLKERFLSKKELSKIDNTHQTLHLLLHWAAKEVLFKIIDEEEVDFSKHFQIKTFNIKKEGTFEGIEYKTKEKSKYLFQYKINSQYVIVWSIKKEIHDL